MMFIIWLTLFGLFFGSFLNVLIDRITNGEQFWKGRSHCDYCKHTLSWYDLIPLFSFLLLQGKCRYCHKRLSYYYPFLEICTAFLFVLTYLVLPDKSIINIFYYLIIVSSLIVIFFTDLKYTLIPFVIVIPLCILVYLHIFIFTPGLLFSTLISAFGVMVFFLILFFLTQGKGMGFGDVVYAFLMGSILDYPRIIVGLYLAFIIGAIVGLLYIFISKKKLKGTTIPFGPFLVLGTYIALFFSQPFLAFYSQFMPSF